MTTGTTLRVPVGQESPIKCRALLQKEGWFNRCPRANKQTSSVAWYVQESERVCHQANSVMLRMASIPEGTK